MKPDKPEFVLYLNVGDMPPPLARAAVTAMEEKLAKRWGRDVFLVVPSDHNDLQELGRGWKGASAADQAVLKALAGLQMTMAQIAKNTTPLRSTVRKRDAAKINVGIKRPKAARPKTPTAL